MKLPAGNTSEKAEEISVVEVPVTSQGVEMIMAAGTGNEAGNMATTTGN